MKDLQVWLTYHDKSQIEEYGLIETDIIRLFRGNDTQVSGKNINGLNKFYSEICTLYYVWKNNLRSSTVGFCHYRRKFQNVLELEKGQCQVLDIKKNSPIFPHYKLAHNFQDLYDVIEILENKYGKTNKYSQYLMTGNVFVPFCSFIMWYNDFNHLCDWLFPILFAWDEKNKLGMNPEKYMKKAQADFRYDNVDYQCRAVAFLAERLVSCYIVTEMHPLCVSDLNTL